MRKILLFLSLLSVVSVLVSCEKEPAKSETILTASIQNVETRTYLGSLSGSSDLIWEDGDVFVVAKDVNLIGSTLVNGGKSNKAKFSIGADMSSDAWYACYPAKYVTGANTGTSFTFNMSLFPDGKLTYNDNPFSGGYMPMAGKYESGAINFTPLMSAICISLYNDSTTDEVNVSSITIASTSSSHNLCGNATVSWSDNTPSLSMSTSSSGNDSLTMTDITILKSETKSFIFPVPAGENTLSVTVNKSTGVGSFTKNITSKKFEKGTVHKLKTLNIKDGSIKNE